MKQSDFFTKTYKAFPEGEETKNAKFLIKGGFVSKASSGVYSILPLGLRVLKKINNIVREEMDAIGSEEILMPSLIDRKYWEKSGRWNVDVVYKTNKNKKQDNEAEFGLGWTHEEVVADIAKNFIQSYKDLPKSIYQIQTKFRAETRAQGGLLRGREFLMKDLYSFDKTQEDLNKTYERVIGAYKTIFKRLGLKTIVTEASGGDFTKEYTHEFQVLNDAGEDTIYFCDECGFSKNKEIYIEKTHTKCKGDIKESRGIEVANVFKLGIRYSKYFDLIYQDENGDKHFVFMGSYGLGLTRVMATIVEEFSDGKGIIWPESISPFALHFISLGKNNKSADRVFEILKKAGVEVLYDDRNDVSAGEKFADSDLIGIPYRAILSDKTGEKIELKKRDESDVKFVEIREIAKLIKGEMQDAGGKMTNLASK